MHAMTSTEIFLLAMILIFSVPYLIWRLGRTDYFAPLVVVQILAGILLGPGVMGAIFPDYYQFVFNPQVIQSLNGIAWWAVMIFVWLAGIELDLHEAWKDRYESGVTAFCALFTPLAVGCVTAAGMSYYPGWIGSKGQTWQFIVGVGMSCAVTALPILILLMEKMEILKLPIGQRAMRYASIDDIAIWGVLALILLDTERLGRQLFFLVAFSVVTLFFRALMKQVEEPDRWFLGFIWLAACGFAADWAGLHYMVGAFLSGAVMDSSWFDTKKMDLFRNHILIAIMPVFFLSTGLKTNWTVGGGAVFLAAALLLVASVGGKILGVHIAGHILKWPSGETSFFGYLLQTKGLIMIIFSNILLDKEIITNETFTALLLMASASTMITIPVATPIWARLSRR
jgi:Kef-type K+ transport system membrane component KefB